jgi:thiamine biosynthesis lipoprotein
MGEHRMVEVMGTVFSIDVRDPGSYHRVTDELTRWWQWVDRTFSPFRADSEISRLNRAELRPGDCSSQVLAVRALCRRAKRVTHGYFDAHAAGRFDPSGLVKGWSIETASAMLTRAGSRNHCINGGGDVRCVGQPEPGRPWHVGIADPHRSGKVTATALVGDAAVATSGTAQRGAHVLDPHTGRPATALASVTVVGSNLTWVDAYATAAVAMGEQALAWLCTLDGHEGLVIAADGSRRHTPGFPASSREPYAAVSSVHSSKRDWLCRRRVASTVEGASPSSPGDVMRAETAARSRAQDRPLHRARRGE